MRLIAQNGPYPMEDFRMSLAKFLLWVFVALVNEEGKEKQVWTSPSKSTFLNPSVDMGHFAVTRFICFSHCLLKPFDYRYFIQIITILTMRCYL